MVEKQVGFNIFARDGASKEFAKVGESADKAGRKVAESMGKMRAGLAGGLGFGGATLSIAAIGGAIGGAVKMAANFQEGLTALVTGAGEAEKNIAMVGKGILKMSGDVGTSTKQLTDGMYMIESAGFHGAAGLNVLKVAAEGAKVGNTDLGTMANAVTSALNAYRMPATQAAKVTNILIATVASGKMHMSELASSLGAVLPAASAAHVGLAEVGGAIATMTAQGTPAADAATYLRQTILNLSNPTHKAATEMKDLGLDSIKVSQNLGTRGLASTMTMLTDAIQAKLGPAGVILIERLQKLSGHTTAFQKALVQLPPTQQTAVAALAAMVGGTKSMQAALELTGPNMATFKANSAAIAEKAKAAGSSVEGWAQVQQDFNFKIEQVKNKIIAFATSVGVSLLPILTKAAGWIGDKLPAAFNFVTTAVSAVSTSFRNGMTDATGFAGFMQQVGVEARALWDIFTTDVLPVLKSFAGFVTGTVIPALVGFGGWLVKYRGWLMPIAGGVLAIVAAVKIYQGVVTVITAATKAWAAVQAALNIVMSLNPFALVVLALIGLGTALYIAWKKSETFRDIVKGVWTAVQQAFGNAVGAIIQFAIHPIVSAFLWMAENITGLAAKAFGWVPGLGPKLKGAHQAVEDFKAGVDNTLTRLANTAYGLGDNAGRNIGQGVADGIHSKIPAVRAAATLLAYNSSRSVIDHVRATSPSKLFREIGQMVGEGFALGHEDKYGRVSSAARGMAATAVGGSVGSMTLPAGGQVAMARIGGTLTGRDAGRPVTIVLQLDGQPIARTLARLNRNGATIIKLTT